MFVHQEDRDQREIASIGRERDIGKMLGMESKKLNKLQYRRKYWTNSFIVNPSVLQHQLHVMLADTELTMVHATISTNQILVWIIVWNIIEEN